MSITVFFVFMSDLHRPHKALGLCGKLNLTKQNVPLLSQFATLLIIATDYLLYILYHFCLYLSIHYFRKIHFNFLSFFTVPILYTIYTYLSIPFHKKIPKAFLLSVFFNVQLIVKNFIKYALIGKFGIKFFKIINVFF